MISDKQETRGLGQHLDCGLGSNHRPFALAERWLVPRGPCFVRVVRVFRGSTGSISYLAVCISVNALWSRCPLWLQRPYLVIRISVNLCGLCVLCGQTITATSRIWLDAEIGPMYNTQVTRRATVRGQVGEALRFMTYDLRFDQRPSVFICGSIASAALCVLGGSEPCLQNKANWSECQV